MVDYLSTRVSLNQLKSDTSITPDLLWTFSTVPILSPTIDERLHKSITWNMTVMCSQINIVRWLREVPWAWFSRFWNRRRPSRDRIGRFRRAERYSHSQPSSSLWEGRRRSLASRRTPTRCLSLGSYLAVLATENPKKKFNIILVPTVDFDILERHQSLLRNT